MHALWHEHAYMIWWYDEYTMIWWTCDNECLLSYDDMMMYSCYLMSIYMLKCMLGHVCNRTRVFMSMHD